MYTIIISLLVGFSVGIALSLADLFHISLGIIVGFILSVVVFIMLGRKRSKLVMPQMETAQRLMQNQKFKQAIELLESLRIHGKWMMLLEGQVDALIGMIHYIQNKEDLAFQHLEKATAKHWYAMIIYGFLLNKRKKEDLMIKKFEFALKLTRKEPLLWNAYAYCLELNNKQDAAIEVLNRAVKRLGTNQETINNLKNLQNQKKMNMKPFGEMWYGLRIERAPRQFQKAPDHPGYRGFKQKRMG